MGPRSHERGEWEPLPTSSASNTLQWGRALTSAERGPAPQAEADARRASMGPRSHERGEITREGMRALMEAASMGPRSHERGEQLEAEIRRHEKKLQWGRALTSAESGNPGSGFVYLYPLQWGRALTSAESCSRRRGVRSGPRFNGAALSRARRAPGLRRRTPTWRSFNGAALSRARRGPSRSYWIFKEQSARSRAPACQQAVLPTRQEGPPRIHLLFPRLAPCERVPRKRRHRAARALLRAVVPLKRLPGDMDEPYRVSKPG